MTNINCLIIDDEPLSVNVIKNFIEEINNISWELDTKLEIAMDALRTPRIHTLFHFARWVP